MNGAASHDDVIFYRETANLPLAELEQMGPAAQEAYRQMAATEHFTPHIRCDIEFEAITNMIPQVIRLTIRTARLAVAVPLQVHLYRSHFCTVRRGKIFRLR